MTKMERQILYIEDHEDTRELVTLILADSNCRVTTASTGVEALKLARNMKFDLYILDSRLPDGSGVDLCEQLRNMDQRTPIMFLSAAAYESDKEAAIRNGAQRYLVKPGDIHLLKSEVEALMAPSVNKHDQAGVAQSHSYLSEGADAESKAYGSMGFVASQLLTTPGA